MAARIFLQEGDDVCSRMERVRRVDLLLEKRRRLAEDDVPRRHAVVLRLEVVVRRVYADLYAVRGGHFGGLAHLRAKATVGVLRVALRMGRSHAQYPRLGADVERPLELVADEEEVAVHVRANADHASVGEKPAERDSRPPPVLGKFNAVITGHLQGCQAFLRILPENLADRIELRCESCHIITFTSMGLPILPL